MPHEPLVLLLAATWPVVAAFICWICLKGWGRG
jgi:hypothetical protein